MRAGYARGVYRRGIRMDFGDLGDVGGAIRGNADPHQQRNSCLDFPRLFTGTRSKPKSPTSPKSTHGRMDPPPVAFPALQTRPHSWRRGGRASAAPR